MTDDQARLLPLELLFECTSFADRISCTTTAQGLELLRQDAAVADNIASLYEQRLRISKMLGELRRQGSDA